MPSRSEICKGNLPQTVGEVEEEVKEEVQKSFTSYIVVAVLLSAIIAAAATAAFFKFCVMGNTAEVTPRE